MSTDAPTKRRFFRRREESRDLTRESVPAAFFPEGGSPDAPGVKSAKRIGDVYACLRALGDGAALIPLRVYRKTGTTTQVVEDAPVCELLERPAPAVPAPAFLGEAVAWLAAAGECFVGCYRNGPDDSVTQLGLLDPARVKVELFENEPVYTYTSPTGQISGNLTSDSVIHIRGALTVDGIRGMSPIRACSNALTLAQSLTTSAAALWDNDATPGGILVVPEGPGADDQAESLSTDWEARHRGPKKRGRIAVLTGAVEYTQTTLSAVDSEYVASRNLSTQEICRIFRVLPWVVGAPTGDSLTYANTSEQQAAFAKFSLAPLLTYVETALSLNEDLFPGGLFCKFDMSELTRGDAKSRAELNTKALATDGTGWMSRAEVRAQEGLAPEEEPTA